MTTWVSLYQKGKTSLDLYEARGDGVLGCSAISWTICKQSCSRQITTPTPHHSVFTGRVLFLMPYQQFQSTKKSKITNSNLSTISETDRISLRILTACWIFPIRAVCQEMFRQKAHSRWGILPTPNVSWAVTHTRLTALCPGLSW